MFFVSNKIFGLLSAMSFGLILVLMLLAVDANAANPATESARINRYVVAVSANNGGSGRPMLRYAESDARSFAKVLKEMGGVQPQNVILVREPSVAALQKEFSNLDSKILENGTSNGRNEVLVYYSGHADEKGLRLGEETYTWKDLRNRIDALSADVKIAVIDACGSGAITRVKGGKAVPAVIRYGIGFVQGIDLAAQEMGITENVVVNYAYSKSFEASESITEAMRQWFVEGMQVIFPCGGAIWTSAAKAAAEYNGRVIGVDTDQSSVINTYGQNMCLTSAVKNIGRSVRYMLNKIKENQFNDFGGKAETLGMISRDDPDLNFLQLPTESWSMTNFTQDDYRKLVSRIVDGEIKVLSSSEDKHNYAVTLNIHPTIK